MNGIARNCLLAAALLLAACTVDKPTPPVPGQTEGDARDQTIRQFIDMGPQPMVLGPTGAPGGAVSVHSY